MSPLPAVSRDALLDAPSWIFQGNPDWFDIEAAVRELPHVSWLVRQHADAIRAGDRVYFWVSGPNAGIVAVGTIVADPADRELDEAERRFCRDPDRFAGVHSRVPIRIDEVLPERIRRTDLREHPGLHDLTILQLAQGTNFTVRPDQAAALQALFAARRPPASEPLADRHPIAWNPPMPFSSLLQELAANGLHVAPESIANYLLALQTKRFVILTGISGTGKTHIALAVARAFQPRVITQSPRQAVEGAVELQVQPYMVKYHRLTLPTSLRANLTLPSLDRERNSGQIDVLSPAGLLPLRFYRDPDRPVVELLFSGAFRDWFETELQVGDRFHIDVVPQTGDNGSADRLRVSLPVTELRQAPLDNVCVVAVRPDWTDHRGLLGYHNPLAERYVSTPLLDTLLRARAEYARARRDGERSPHPYFLILDEMNLAHVEHYFSDFLSAMESGEPIELHADATIEAGEGADGVALPRRITIPPNVYFTGTVNIDETTAMFSPKVLDRAFTIEFDRVDLAGYGMEAGPSDQTPTAYPAGLHLDRFPGELGTWRQPTREDWRHFSQLLDGALRDTVVGLHGLLTEHHRHFGYRVANEIARFVMLAAEQSAGTPSDLRAALDLAILEKVLPKFHGTQQELEAPLQAIFGFLVAGRASERPTRERDEMWAMVGGRLAHRDAGPPAAGGAPDDLSSSAASSPAPAFPRSAAKVWRMLARMRQQGFTSFIE